MTDLLSVAAWLAVALGTPSLKIRLETHLTSYASHRGAPFTATVIAPYEWDGRVRIPAGSTLYGHVSRARSVGLGWGRERASLQLAFDEYRLPDGRRFPLRAMIRTVDNAREEVSEGKIRGIVAAAAPNGLVRGLWGRPTTRLLARSPMGLTGLSGRIWSEYALGPIGVGGLMAARMALFRMPEPEIHLPPGAELRLAVMALPAQAPTFERQTEGTLAESLAQELRAYPAGVARANGQPVTDIINVAILGTREQIAAVFLSAGWYPAETLTKRSFARSWAAFTRNQGYATAPVSKLYQQEAEPDLVFQKSFNSIAKRHHVRLWSAGQIDGAPLWVGAATHDTSIGFEPNRVSLTHRVDPRIDRERAKLVNDLQFTGCALPVTHIERPELARDSPRRVTDGKLAVLTIRDCEPGAWANSREPGPRRPGNPASRLARRVALETRNYLIRDNAYYWTIRLLRKRPAIEVRSGG